MVLKFMGTVLVAVLGGAFTWVTIMACEKFARRLIAQRELDPNSLGALLLTIGLIGLDGAVLILAALGLWALNAESFSWAQRTRNVYLAVGIGGTSAVITIGILYQTLRQLWGYLRTDGQ
ncbi:hypothetical protein [Levilactobacillus acidifarinae]|uniref:Uncharacterized protein n=1 Tax=Levilactobacillus acidifarinae DSM 19394 = JCM 15949 TaxID=1423715 RepID=A0A0R1LFD5_9LACO|nr:hypothetical protein [Levilactobacillus acidifarinae]KRK94492.1 hypothetical protein FD25_GL000457 [Levilactobacillus acidifarinae DSM 19394]GEO68236.1 hypothetical protein LAC03_01460 [Levilactobacillus acidifarinae]